VSLSEGLEVSCKQISLPEPGKGQRCRFVFRDAARDQFPPAFLEVLREFLDNLAFACSGQAQGCQP
jgi:hypothetical protein